MLEEPALAADPRFATPRDRYHNRLPLWAHLEEAFKARPAAEWVARLEAQSVPVAVVNTLGHVVADPQIRHRGMVTEIAAPDGRHARVMGNPMKFADAPAAAARFAPRLGESTVDVLHELLGLSADEIDGLERERVVVSSPSPAGGGSVKRTK